MLLSVRLFVEFETTAKVCTMFERIQLNLTQPSTITLIANLSLIVNRAQLQTIKE